MRNLGNNIKRIFNIFPKSTLVVALLIIVCIGVIFGMRKKITVVVDGKPTQIITFSSNLKTSLEKNNIHVGVKDEISTKIDSKVKNGEKVYIKRAVNVHVAVDGKMIDIATTEPNVSYMLKAEGITVSDYDKVSPLKTESIKKDMKITIVRVSSKIEKETKNIDFPTEIEKDDTINKDITKVVQEGQAGERELVSRVVYEDGKEVSRQVVSDSVTKNPVKRVLLQGTLEMLNFSRGGQTVSYKRLLKVKATAYSACKACTGKSKGDKGYAITASGTTAKRNADGYSTIAVDPRVIPLGTKVYVEGYGYAVAEDTGGAIKGNIIDVFFNTYAEAKNWGVKHPNIYILK